ncbi:PP2C family protein-serine/threonine phosphatase [Enterococcus cecorum]|uniref:PP2C family protein-serine/threonine phosphatase n=1 Tax=Enterococcus cecorum TaxID=44008 RepID=UPI001FAC1E65|nr:protein phosphatase 2C domain-containing protein [Enterococcus cecorum]MCJ0538610.1 protein phosphatase 2C domain-containing protein [Enterococcus cecorum]MCJ0547062.1 protein phosphatase 2C domain-containing protein [Enterococcus cecorum]MCJ0551086.1 protein phosphatase 2C domain-containing protein [Enterococcus cecorum]MCJ0569864.1 protein phosphatase 2C domain-containing protein [Enterococcus cecorum]
MCQVYSFSHIGNSRENHEDNYLLGKRYLLPEQVKQMSQIRKLVTDQMELRDSFCVAVSDGMGGYECGEVASLLTVQYLSSHSISTVDDIKPCILELNNYVCAEAKKSADTRNMGATLCGVLSSEKQAFGFNVGDSRLYQYANGILKQVTVDNTEGQRLLDLGLLTEEEVKTFPKRKAIYKYIGKDVELVPDIYEINDIEKGTMLLLCSDGLSDVLDLEEIQDMLSKQFIKTEDKGKFLVEMAVERKPDAGDNITLIIIEY